MTEYFMRDWKIDDVQSIAKYANNRLIANRLRDGFPHPYSTSDARRFIENAMSQTKQTMFAIANQNEAIGSIGLFIGKDVHRFTAELGCWLAEPFWNKGIMTSILQEFAAHVFNKLELMRIYAEPYSNNTASVRVLEKAGFQYEGCLRANAIKNGEILDQFVYSKIAEKLHNIYMAFGCQGKNSPIDRKS